MLFLRRNHVLLIIYVYLWRWTFLKFVTRFDTIERKSVTLVTKIAPDIDREKFQISSIQNQKREIEQASCTNTNIKPEQDGLPRFTMANHVKPNN